MVFRSLHKGEGPSDYTVSAYCGLYGASSYSNSMGMSGQASIVHEEFLSIRDSDA